MAEKSKGESKKFEDSYPYKKIELSPDPNTNEVISDILTRCKQGMDKFGITMRSLMLQNPKDSLYWLNNSYEEKIDDLRYLKEAIQSFRNLNEENKKLIQENLKLKNKLKKEKEYSKLLNEHP
jgi:CII-binding regulator of phage lambda lysogenization HflD